MSDAPKSPSTEWLGLGPPIESRPPKRARVVTYTPQQTRMQLQLIRQLLVRGVTSQESIRDAIERALGVRLTASRVRNLISRVYATWNEEEATHASRSKDRAKRRLLEHIAKAAGRGKKGDADYIRPDFAAVARLEELLAKIEGTMEPARMQVDIAHNQAVLNVLATMSPQEIQAALDEQREVERLAEEARQARLVAATTVEVIGDDEAAE